MTIASHRSFAALCIGAAAASVLLSLPARGQEAPPDPEKVLGTLVVPATGQDAAGLPPLPKLGVQPSLSADIEDVTLHAVARRDLDLCGEFEIIADADAPEGLYLSDSPVDVEAWKKKGAEYIVKVHGTKLPSGKVELKGWAYVVELGDKAAFSKTLVVEGDGVRLGAHRLVDALIGAMTGTPGGFASQMTFVFGAGRSRRVYVMDADGHDPRPVSAEDQLALAPAFGPGQKLYYAASIKHDAFKVFTPGSPAPIPIIPNGSVYSLAFNAARDKVAVSIADGPNIKLYTGPDLSHLSAASPNNVALQPAFSSTGSLAFSGAGRFSQQIHVDGKPISPAGLHASSPTFCRHPDGIRVIYAVGAGRATDLVSATPNGGGTLRLTVGAGQNNYPACSPDGRIVAFFSTRSAAPGLYVMRIDGRRPKRVSTLVGDSLQWAPLPPEEPKAP